MLEMKINYYKNISKEGSSIVAVFGVYIENLDLHLSKLKLIKTQAGQTFVAMPSEAYEDKETGEKKYKDFFWFGKKMKDAFQEKCLQLIKAEQLKEQEKIETEAAKGRVQLSNNFDDGLPF